MLHIGGGGIPIVDKAKRYFKKIHNQLETGFTKAYKEYGLTGTQLDILRYLSENPAGENTLTDIASHFGVKHTSVIHVLKLLEKKGLIRKNPVQGTRAKPILLTDKGESLCRQIISKMERQDPLLDQIMFAGLSESDRQHLEKMLGQIYRNLESDAFRNLQNSNVPEPDSLRN